MKTKIQRRVKVFFKVAIGWLLMGLSKNFTVRAPKRLTDDKHHKTSKEQLL